jgi:hypothetical protein
MDPLTFLGISFFAWCVLIAVVTYYIGRPLWKAICGMTIFAGKMNGPSEEYID